MIFTNIIKAGAQLLPLCMLKLKTYLKPRIILLPSKYLKLKNKYLSIIHNLEKTISCCFQLVESFF